MPRRKIESQGRFAEWVRIEDEVARANRLHLDARVTPRAQGQRMQQVRRLAKVHASEQREIVSGLQQTEVVKDGGFSKFRRAAQTPFNLIFEARA